MILGKLFSLVISLSIRTTILADYKDFGFRLVNEK